MTTPDDLIQSLKTDAEFLREEGYVVHVTLFPREFADEASNLQYQLYQAAADSVAKQITERGHNGN